MVSEGMKVYGETYEDIIEVFILPDKDPFISNSEKKFFLNTLFLFIILYVIRFTVDNHIPRVSEALGILVGYSIVIILLLRYIAFFNTHVSEWGIGGLGYHIAFLTLLMLFLGIW